MASPLSPAFPITPPQEEVEIKESKLDFDHPLLQAGLSAPTPPKTPEILSEEPLSSDASTPAQHEFEASSISKVPAAAKKTTVNLVKAVEPPVTYTEIFLFVVWMFSLFFKQLWRDLLKWNWYKPLLASDFMTHYFVSTLVALRFQCRSSPSFSTFQQHVLVLGSSLQLLMIECWSEASQNGRTAKISPSTRNEKSSTVLRAITLDFHCSSTIWKT